MSETAISPELVARMVKLVRGMCAMQKSPYGNAIPIFDEAFAILAELPKPVDPDLIEARAICAEMSRQEGSPAYVDIYISGQFDDGGIMRRTLAAIRRGRELERGKWPPPR